MCVCVCVCVCIRLIHARIILEAKAEYYYFLIQR